MASAAIVTIGNELLSGDVENTNGSWLARRLEAAGVDVRLIAVVPDGGDGGDVRDDRGGAASRSTDRLVAPQLPDNREPDRRNSYSGVRNPPPSACRLLSKLRRQRSLRRGRPQVERS